MILKEEDTFTFK